jgi:hypothetical protein
MQILIKYLRYLQTIKTHPHIVPGLYEICSPVPIIVVEDQIQFIEMLDPQHDVHLQVRPYYTLLSSDSNVQLQPHVSILGVQCWLIRSEVIVLISESRKFSASRCLVGFRLCYYVPITGAQYSAVE